MDCPRCGVSVFAELNSCRSCGWQLSRPFSGQSRVSVSPNPSFSSSGVAQTFVSARAERPPIQTAADALPEDFFLSPPARPQQHPRRRHRRREPPTNGSAVAVLPKEARWESPPRFEVIEMPLVQAAFDFTAAELEAEQLAGRAVAPVSLRFQAGLLDSSLILLASAVFFALFALLGGEVGLARRDLLIYIAAGFVLASLYFGLFTLLGGRTPGMQYYHLRVVTFEGQPLPPPRALWRAFGYMVSLGALALGFLWALVDERRLTWHDRISRTFLTDRAIVV